MSFAQETEANLRDMVVIQYGGHVLKGYTQRSAWTGDWCADSPVLSPPIRLLNADTEGRVPLDGVKAVFFVRSFDGRSHDDLRFHDGMTPMECLWIRILFQDGEVIEGTIPNGCDYLLQDGFFVHPIDPEGNNWLMYVCKRKIKSFNVLGLRPGPCGMFGPGEGGTG